METPKPQEEQNDAQTKLDDLLGPAPVSNEEKATNAAEAMGVTLTPDVAKPLTEGPVVIPAEVAHQVAESLATAGAAAVLVDEKGAVTVPPEHVIKAALEAASGASPIKTMNPPEGAVTPPADVQQVFQTLSDKVERIVEKAKAKAKRKTKKSKKPYHRLEKPRRPAPHGLFDLKAKAGKTLGVKCIFCKGKLKYKSGRPPIICKKVRCFRDLRNAYRRDYAKAIG